MKIQLKRSNVLSSGAAKTPTASQLEYGELAVNYNNTDPAIFLKDSNNNVIRISGVGNISDDGLTNVPDGTTPPSNPEVGNLWYNSDQGRLYIYFQDADTSQWVDASPDSWDPSSYPDVTNSSAQSNTLDDRYAMVNGGNGLKIDSSGRLLVGTTTEGHSDADNLTIADSSKAGITIRNTTTTGDGAIFFSDATSGTAEYAGYIEYGHSTNHLRFATASTERMRIDSSGNVKVIGSGTVAAPNIALNADGFYTSKTSNGHVNLNVSTGAFLASPDGNTVNATCIINHDGSIEIAGGNTGSSTGSAGATFNANGLLSVRRSDSASSIFAGYAVNGTSPVINLKADGTATFASTTTVGGGALNGGAAGVSLYPTGGIHATQASGTSTVFSGYIQGSSTKNVAITANGSAAFANRVDTGALTVDSNLTPTSGESIEFFYNSGGYIQAYDRNNGAFKPLRIKSSNYEIGSDGSATFSGKVQSENSTNIAELASGANTGFRLLQNGSTANVVMGWDGTATFVNRCDFGNTSLAETAGKFMNSDASSATLYVMQYNGSGDLFSGRNSSNNEVINLGVDGSATFAGDLYAGDPAGNSYKQGITVRANGAASYTQIYCQNSMSTTPLSLYNGDTSSNVFTVDESGNSTFAGTVKQGTFNGGQTTTDGSVLLDSGGVYTQITASSTSDLYRGYKGNSLVFKVEDDGSITGAGDVQVGGASYGNAQGVVIGTDGYLRVTYSGNNDVFRGYALGSTTATSRISANGSASFAGDLSIENSSYIRVRTTGDDTSTAIQLGPDGSINAASTITAGTETGTGTNVYASGSIQGIVSGTQKWYLSPTGSATFASFVEVTRDTGNQTAFASYLSGSTDSTFKVTANGSATFGGNVGIGTTSPQRALVVSDAGTEGFEFYPGSSAGNNTVNHYNRSTSSFVNIITTADQHIFSRADGEKMRIDSSGRLIVGRTASVASGSAADSLVQIVGKKSSPTDLGQLTIARGNSASNLTSGAEIGEIIFSDNAGANFAQIQCNTDGASGTDDYPGRLTFSTTADGASAPTERMRITSSTDGQLLIGCISDSNSAEIGVKLKGGSAATVDVVTNAASNINLNHVYNINATRNGYRYYLSIDGGIRNFSGSNVNLSDEREKKNIIDMDSTWSELKQWTLRQFHFNEQDNSEDKCYGVIAQQIETVSPQVLSTFETNPTTIRKGVKEQKMMWMAIKALQEAMAKIETLETKVAALEAG